MALKSYKPTTPGQRGLVLIDRSELWKGRPVKSLTEGLCQKGGRNNTGRIPPRRRGGGAQRPDRTAAFTPPQPALPATAPRQGRLRRLFRAVPGGLATAVKAVATVSGAEPRVPPRRAFGLQGSAPDAHQTRPPWRPVLGPGDPDS